MKPITVYEANDGSRWNSADKAIDRDREIAIVDNVMSPFGPRFEEEGSCRYENGRGFVKHDTATVASVKRALIDLSRPRLSEWMETQEKVHSQDLMDCHPSWFCRLLDGGGPLTDAWSRLACFDKCGREWGQPYYALNPDKGEQIQLNA